MPCSFDVSQTPLIVSTLEGDISEVEAEKLVEEMYAWQEEGTRCGTVNDLSKFNLPSSRVRKILKGYADDSESFFATHLVCMATVIENPVVRMTMEAANILKSPVCPTKFFKRREDAIAWVRGMLKKEGLL